MEKNSETLVLQERPQKGNMGPFAFGSAVAGPIGGIINVGLNKAAKWARKAVADHFQKLKKDKNDKLRNKKHNDYMKYKQQQNQQNQYSDDDIKQKAQDAQDNIRNQGMFEPEVYDAHKFYKTTIYDTTNPESNNFVYISKNRNGKQATEAFLEYWKQKYINKYSSDTFRIANSEVDDFVKTIKARFKTEMNKPCLISVPQYFMIDQPDVLSMAKNSDILQNSKVVYNDRPSFDSNYVFDVHMYQNKSEAIEDDFDEYKVSLIITGAYGRNYTYAYDTVSDPHKEAEKVMLELGQDLINDAEDTLFAFTKIVEQFVDNERIITNKYTVAAPLLRKNSTNAEDLEYNHALLDGMRIYDSEEEFIKNYLEDYSELVDKQMGL